VLYRGFVAMTRLARAAGVVLLALLTAAVGIWATLAMLFSGPHDDAVRNGATVIVALISALALVAVGLRRWRWRALGTYLVLFAALVVWWRGIEPSNSRDWQADVALQARATIEGDVVTVHNIRNFDYRSEYDYTPAYYDKRFDLSKLVGVDLVAVYWMGPAIAHTFVSFAFADGEHLAISIETRKEKGEGYSTIKGFFRQYEIMYVVADERDLVGLRTNYREKGKGEDVYLYRLNVPPEIARKVFLSYINKVNRLKEKPEWYNALTDNCTTSILRHTMPYNPNARLDWRLIVNGYIDEMLYERKLIDTSLPFAELKKLSYINPRAKAADKSPDFSQLIRVGLPAKELKQ